MNGHIGQTGWRIPERNIMPELKRMQVKPGADMGVAVEGTTQVWVKDRSAIGALPAFHSLLKERHYFGSLI